MVVKVMVMDIIMDIRDMEAEVGAGAAG